MKQVLEMTVLGPKLKDNRISAEAVLGERYEHKGGRLVSHPVGQEKADQLVPMLKIIGPTSQLI